MSLVLSVVKAGEVYSREDAEAERTKVLKAFEVIDTLSKKILRLTPNDKDTNSATTEALHRRIRAYVVRFLQDSTFELKHMPSEDDIKRWRAEKSAEKIRRREEEERRVNTKREEVKLTGSPSKTADTYKAKSEKVGKGWTPTLTDQASVKALTDDPLLQQINIISGYLNQAQSSQKWDEANALEANLKELHLEKRAREMRQNEEVAGFYE
ncbi:putative rabenosyn-5 [Apostichopus japonicus]|uniref:Putative rabenosyn-5 n=1 Tax=Stichopus japonicus TaxID=307972 RepID=A0A2G8JB01_STIJA|nr:putative rabenosyn-5 [Apostichopus japonicus]